MLLSLKENIKSVFCTAGNRGNFEGGKRVTLGNSYSEPYPNVYYLTTLRLGREDLVSSGLGGVGSGSGSGVFSKSNIMP